MSDEEETMFELHAEVVLNGYWNFELIHQKKFKSKKEAENYKDFCIEKIPDMYLVKKIYVKEVKEVNDD